MFTAGGVSVVHLGDLGHALSAEQLAAIGPVDGVLVPVGGVYTVDAQGAKAACDAIGPKWIVPMHYHHAPYGLPDIAGVEDFLALWPAEQVHSLPGAGLDTETAPEGVLLPKFWLTRNSKSRNIVLNTGLHGLEVRLWSAEQRSHFWGILF